VPKWPIKREGAAEDPRDELGRPDGTTELLVSAHPGGSGDRAVPAPAEAGTALYQAAPDGESLRILFVMRHAGYVRNFEWVLRALAERGHRLHLGFEVTADTALPERLRSDTAGAITFGALPARDDRWRSLAFGLRQSVSYLRYLSPGYRDAVRLRQRWARKSPRLVVRLTSTRWLRSGRRSAVLERVLRIAERLVPRSRVIGEHVRAGGYDAVMVTPLVNGPSQHDWLRAALEGGLPAILAVASWDNLTNKGVVFDRPDRTYVWNELQRREAIELQGLERESVVVVGAHSFDHWFDWRPSRTREELCAEIGLDPSQPFVLYVCSSTFIVRDERPVVARWLEALRSDSTLRDVGVLVRPHPLNGTVWLQHGLSAFGNVAVWPAMGADPTDEERRAGYFDSLFHAGAVVGANTTALVEAAIVGTRTFSILLPELRGSQEQTLHFRHLTAEEGGALTVATSLEEHVRQLRDELRGHSDGRWRETFLRSFVRPFGLEEPGTPRFVQDLEASVARLRASAPSPSSRR
jgi:hypothetical protein